MTDFAKTIARFKYSTDNTDDLNVSNIKRKDFQVGCAKIKRNTKVITKDRQKPKRKSLSYAAPSAYSHIATPELDAFAEGLLGVFIGLNPGIATAKANHCKF